jgi:iron complex outermembrane receptor protein
MSATELFFYLSNSRSLCYPTRNWICGFIITCCPWIVFLSLMAGFSNANNFPDNVDDEDKEISEIVITGDKNRWSGSLLESIRAIEVFDAEAISSLQGERVEDIISYEPSVLVSSLTAGSDTSLFIRGYRTDNGNVFVNDHQDNKRLFTRDLDTVEEINIIKGHSSVLFGSGSPGGTIHYTTKTPKRDPQTNLKVVLGSFQKQRFVVDANNMLSDLGVAYRLVAIGQRANSFMANVGNDKEILLASVVWKSSDNTRTARCEIEYDHLTNPYSYGTIQIGDEVLYNQSYVDPRSSSDRRYLRASFYGTQPLSNSWNIDGLINHVTLNRNDIMMGFCCPLDEQMSRLRGHWSDSDNKFWQTSAKLSLQGKILTSNMVHDVVLGMDYNASDNRLNRISSNGFTLDSRNPSFDSQEPRDIAVQTGFHYRDSDKSIYLADKISLNNTLSLNIGFRRSYFSNWNRKNNTQSVDKYALASALGLLWQLNQRIRTYASYAKSFEPNTGVSRDGKYFDPRQAEQLEIGAHYKPSKRLSVEMVIYKLGQKNLLTRDPLDRAYSIPAGARQTRGIELESLLKINQHLSVKLAYSHMDNRIIEEFYGIPIGNTASGIPRNMGSLQLKWANGDIKATLGFVAVGRRYGDARNSFTMAGYGRVDVGVEYKIKQTTLRLNIFNLSDKNFVVASSHKDDIYQGIPKKIILSADYQF